ncbi:MAG: hypothetical protein ABSC25_06140 [Roseiarcus sp.]|jgi:hypothetical protein
MPTVIFLIALASSLPTIDIESTCRSARTAALPEDQSAAYDSCMRDERDAREKLRSDWTKYSADAHAACAETGGFSLSYVELLTCLEMQPGGSLSIQQPGQDAKSKSR